MSDSTCAELWGMLQRCHAIGQRTADTICSEFGRVAIFRTSIHLFDFGERQNALYLRIYALYDATLPIEALRSVGDTGLATPTDSRHVPLSVGCCT